MTLEERKRRMAEAGIPLPKQMVNEGGISSVPVTSQNADKYAKLQALKKGSNKTQVQQLVKSNNPQSGGFQGLPEPKLKRAPSGHPSNQITPGKSVALENFSSQAPSGEFAALEAMYSSGDNYSQPSQSYSQQPSNQSTTQPELSIDQNGYGPSFDPQSILAKKRSQLQKDNPYMKHAVQPEQHAMDMASSDGLQIGGQQDFNFEYMQKMMQEIAKNTISEVLNSYTEKQKSKLTYENYTKTSDGLQVIKTQEGKLFKLVPVKIKSQS